VAAKLGDKKVMAAAGEGEKDVCRGHARAWPELHSRGAPVNP
jgi:hypothetical protein